MEGDYMKVKDNEPEENSKNKNIWEMYKGIIEFKKDYHSCAYLIKKVGSTVVADRNNILSR